MIERGGEGDEHELRSMCAVSTFDAFVDQRSEVGAAAAD